MCMDTKGRVSRVAMYSRDFFPRKWTCRCFKCYNTMYGGEWDVFTEVNVFILAMKQERMVCGGSAKVLRGVFVTLLCCVVKSLLFPLRDEDG